MHQFAWCRKPCLVCDALVLETLAALHKTALADHELRHQEAHATGIDWNEAADRELNVTYGDPREGKTLRVDTLATPERRSWRAALEAELAQAGARSAVDGAVVNVYVSDDGVPCPCDACMVARRRGPLVRRIDVWD